MWTRSAQTRRIGSGTTTSRTSYHFLQGKTMRTRQDATACSPTSARSNAGGTELRRRGRWHRRARGLAHLSASELCTRGGQSGPNALLRTDADAGRRRTVEVDCLGNEAFGLRRSFEKVRVVEVARASGSGVGRHYALQEPTFRFEACQQITVPRPDPDTWIPPEPRAKRHANLQTVKAWQRSRRWRRMEIAAAVVLLAANAAAWSAEVAIGPDRDAEIRAAAAESLSMMLPD